MKNTARDFLSADEIRALTQRSDWAGLRAVFTTWLAIALAFAAVAWLPHPVTWLLAALVIGTRHLALAVIGHEAAHGTLTRSRRLNDVLGQWFAAGPVVQNMYLYRRHHLKHHQHTGTARDPDLRLAAGFPVTRASLVRKLARDLCGLTGIKVFFGSLLMLSGQYRYDVSGDTGPADLRGISAVQQLRMAWRGLAATLFTQLALFALLWWANQALLYLLWWAAWLTVYQFVLRVRAIAEHAMTTDPDDALNNSRTVRARWWERLLVVPLNVNYHLEHHMLAAVPFFRLPQMHALLTERGAFENQPAAVSGSYAALLRQASAA